MPDKIDHTSKLPLYHQLYEILHSKVVNKIWQPGEMIPPESELVKTYSVSRITIRQVLDLLVKENLIYRERGRGSFVSHPSLEQGLTRIVSFTEDMRQRGFKASTKVLAANLVKASGETADKLNVQEGEELVFLVRLRSADNEPMCVEKSCLVHRFCKGILKYNFAKNSLREVKARAFNIKWKYARQTIQAQAAPPDVAKQLSIKPNTPLLYIERVSYSQDNIPVEFLRAYYRADRYTLYNELRGGE